MASTKARARQRIDMNDLTKSLGRCVYVALGMGSIANCAHHPPTSNTLLTVERAIGVPMMYAYTIAHVASERRS